MEDMKNTVQRLLETEQGRCEFVQEELAFDATELISELMAIEKVNKVELAKRVGKSKAYITQVLSGSRNITMHTLAGLTYALGYAVKLQAEPIAETGAEDVYEFRTEAAWRSRVSYVRLSGAVCGVVQAERVGVPAPQTPCPQLSLPAAA